MIPVGLGYVCDRECVRLIAARKKPPKKKPDVPKDVRERVLERDGRCCRWCGRPSSTPHHIHYRSEQSSGPHEVWNLVTLCQTHHDIVHSDKKKWQPVLEALIAFGDMGKWLTVPEVERRLERAASTIEQVEQAKLNTEAAVLRVEAAMASIQADAATDLAGKLPMAWYELHGSKTRLESIRGRLDHAHHLLAREQSVRA
jgi:hypothetical protein